MERLFVSTPIYYVNAKPHLGHAYTTIVADALCRFHSLLGEETFLLTGTDEHGDKIAKAAEEAKLSPKEFVDQISEFFRELCPKLDVQPTQFIRTTGAKHIKCVQQILQKVYDAGDIYFGEYGGHYCFGCERFYTEKELKDGLCPDHQTKPEYITEKNYFFRMSKYQGWLVEHIRADQEFIRPQQYRNEVLSMLESGVLEDLCISRPKSRLTWGVELPFDPDFVCYVWFDALINYLTALDYPKGEKFRKFWPKANHIVAKDILKPHAVFWPTMLKAAGVQPFRHLHVHGHWLVKGVKMSKSLGNVVDPVQVAERFGASAFRYFLLREMAFGADASFSEDALMGRLNADLANDLGNLFNRSLAMTHKYFQGRVPAPESEEPADVAIKKLGQEAMVEYQRLFAELRFSRALEALWELVRGLNKYIDAMAPWALFTGKSMKRLGTVMYVVLEHLRKVALHLWPVMPKAAERMLEQLGVVFEPAKALLTKELDVWGVLESGAEVAASSNLFPRLDLPEPAPPTRKCEKKPCVGPKPEALLVEFEDFRRLDLRVGRIVSAERHPDADKLLLVQVDLGDGDVRQVVAGLAGFFASEALKDRQVVVLANLKPRKLRGRLSQGMILAVKTDAGMELLGPGNTVPDGSRVS